MSTTPKQTETPTPKSVDAKPVNSGLISLELVSRLNQKPMDVRSVARQYALGESEIAREDFLRILKDNGYVSKVKTLKAQDLKKYPLPAVLVDEDKRYNVILKNDQKNETLTVFTPGTKEPKETSYQDWQEQASRDVIVMYPKGMDSNSKFGFGWFYKEILQYKKIIGEVLLGSFIVQLFGLVTPLFTQVILDKVIVHHAMTTLDVLGVAFAAIMLFEFLLNLSRHYIFTHTANKIDAKLGAKLYKHLFSLPYAYFENQKVGNIVARVRELDSIRNFITNKSVSVIIDTLFSGVFLAMMLMYSVKLTAIVMVFITVIAVIYLLITPQLKERLEEKFEMGAKSNSYLVESVTGVQTIKSLALEGAIQRKWEENLGNYINSGFRLNNMSNFTKSLTGLLQRGITITILYLGVKQVINHELTIGQLIAFQMFTGQLIAPILRLVNLWNEFQQTLLAVDRVGDILNRPAEVQPKTEITLPKIEGAIRFDKVSFRYSPDGPNVLNNISLTVPPGKSIGLVGRSGSGKSTITKLLQKLYLPREGAIYIDDVDTRHMNPLWLRYNIGVVLQENYLFSGSVQENIALPRPDATIEEIIKVSQISGAHEFIKEMPEGYNTYVGERGSTLSGGQKQRIAIARALITNPKILIFDEATSALDYESEKIIQTNLKEIQKGRTVFIIAHRLSTVRDCDCILALDRGQIIEGGSHDELMKQKGYYHMLVSQQERVNASQAPAMV